MALFNLLPQFPFFLCVLDLLALLLALKKAVIKKFNLGFRILDYNFVLVIRETDREREREKKRGNS
jgi:hypothetical protein